MSSKEVVSRRPDASERQETIRFYRLREAAEITNISYHSLLWAAKTGHLTCVMVGKAYRVTLRSLEKFIQDLEDGRIILKAR